MNKERKRKEGKMVGREGKEKKKKERRIMIHD